ncbi:MAG: multiheme c-type cytochrome [Phycisphaerae bacterium]
MTPHLAATLGPWVLTAVMTQIRDIPDAEKINPDAFNSAEVCGECHQSIHAVWQHSIHSQAFSSGVFQAAYKAAKESGAPERARLCLECHAPVVRETGDYQAEDSITREGVTCDFCHSIRSVNLDGAAPQVDVDVGRTKYGPLLHAQSPAHRIVDSKLHLRSELCAVCHEYRNEHGVPILETYSEWKASPYAAEGKQCQDCHMPLVPGRVVAMGLKTPAREGVNLHDISGSHDQDRVRNAIKMEILSALRVGKNKVRVAVSVTNAGSGHSFPTGLPMHKAVLEVNLTDRGRQVGRRVIEFEKVLMNHRGLPITQEHEVFLEASSIRNDTRLKPKENRIIKVTFSNVEVPDGQVEVVFWYQYASHVLREKDGVETIEPVEMKFLLGTDKQRLPRLAR